MKVDGGFGPAIAAGGLNGTAVQPRPDPKRHLIVAKDECRPYAKRAFDLSTLVKPELLGPGAAFMRKIEPEQYGRAIRDAALGIMADLRDNRLHIGWPALMHRGHLSGPQVEQVAQFIAHFSPSDRADAFRGYWLKNC